MITRGISWKQECDKKKSYREKSKSQASLPSFSSYEITSLPPNKQISRFWTNIFERPSFHPDAEYISNSYTPQQNNFPPRHCSYSSHQACCNSTLRRQYLVTRWLNWISPQHRVIHVQPTMFQPNNALLMMSAVRWQIRLFKLLQHIHPLQAGYPGNHCSTASRWEGECSS